MLGLQEHITFKEDTHQYFAPNGDEYTSVSRLIRLVEPEFDRKGISANMARAKAKEDGISFDQAQAEILKDWDRNKDSSIDRGNFVHDNLEQYLKTGKCHLAVNNVGYRLVRFLKPFYRYYSEAILYSGKYKTAGTADLSVQRQRDKHKVWDFYDFKTNEKKGIYFDSIKRESDGKIKKHYNRFLKAPLDHLEHSNYNTYALQLSLYAYMAETTFDLKVGRLAIMFINKDYHLRVYPVPYMRMEVMTLLDYHLSIIEASWEGEEE